MHMQLAHTLVAISAITNHARQNSLPSLYRRNLNLKPKSELLKKSPRRLVK